jgi:hypothetical protein
METKTYRAERESEIVPHSTTQNLKQEELDFMINTNPTKTRGELRCFRRVNGIGSFCESSRQMLSSMNS